MKTFICALVLVAISACGTNMVEYRGETNDCSPESEDTNAVLILEESLTGETTGFFGISGSKNYDETWVIAPMESISKEGSKLSFKATMEGSTDLDVDVELELKDKTYSGEVEMKAGSNSLKCDLSMKLEE